MEPVASENMSGMLMAPAEDAVVGKVSRRLLPFLFSLFVVAYLDRVNVGFAALQMKSTLAFSDSIYGFGAGVFFVGYLLFQVPSNLALVRFGARRWLAAIMIAWGIISSGMMLVHTPMSFYVFRFLLGATEAGFFPGVIFYMTHWFPATARARSVSKFLMAMPVAGIFGGPLSGALLSLHGARGLAGWQWLFLLEGAPAIILGAIVPYYLTEKPGDAAWLDPGERACLLGAIEREADHRESARGSFFGEIFFRPETWLLCGAYFTLTWASYGIGLWLPEVVKNFSRSSDWIIGLISVIPYLTAAAVMGLVAASSDRTRTPYRHFAGATFAGAAGFFLATQSSHAALSTVCLSVSVAGIYSAFGPFWAMPGKLVSGPVAAAGIAFINSIGNLGGMFGPYVAGIAKQRTGTFTAGAIILGGVLCLSGFFAITLKSMDRRGQ